MRDDAAHRGTIRRAAVVGDIVLQRRREEQLLSEELRLEVVHASATIRQFMIWLRDSDRTRWPHLLVLNLPALSNWGEELDAVRALRAAGIRVLVLSVVISRALSTRLLEADVDGIVSATDREEDFISVSAAVLAGGRRVAPRASAAMSGPNAGPVLSTQEERVLTLYSSGLTIGEVAVQIGVRHDTARKYLNRVKAKYTAAGRPARTKIELARLAWSDGYAQEPHP